MADPTDVNPDPARHPTVLLAGSADAAADRPDSASRLDLIEVLATTAHTRLRALTLIGAGTFAAGALLALVLPALLGRPPWEQAVMAGLCAFLTALSLATWRLATVTRPAAATIIRLGLAYVVLCALAMACAEVAIGPRAANDYDGVPGMCIWIVLFPLIIPCLPSQALIAALLCAATLPVAYQVMLWLGREPSEANALVRWFAPGFFCAGVSWAAAWIFGRMAGDVARSRREARELGSYRLIERLGEGGMGEVWRARHRLLPREAAVKFVRPAENLRHNPEAVREMSRRFEREAAAIATLRSPHTIQLYDFGLTPEGALFYAMELLDGLDLDELVLRHGPQPEARVAHLLSQACLSLAEAHGAGLVHRDIKPNNLMLCRLGENLDVVKVLDFGLVAAAQNQPAPRTAARAASGIMGTPGFIAPERLLGVGSAGPASDLYGLGAVAFWLLTGTTVFPTADGGEDMVAHSMDVPTAPSRRLGRQIDPVLEQLVLQCLAKRPEGRPPSALALRDRLRAIVFSEPWSDAQARTWWTTMRPQTSTRTASPSASLSAH